MLKTIPLFAVLAAVVPGQAQQPKVAAAEPVPVAFDQVDRSFEVLPALRAARPLYALFLFGAHADTGVWAILDKSDADREGYDRLFLDLDADGDLTEPGECFEAESADGEKASFEIGEWRDPATGAVHEQVSFTWRPERTAYRMMWRGKAMTKGCYGPDGDSYGQFGTSMQNAPIIVPGWDRPFEFERWYGGELTRGKDNDFKVFVGNRGSATGQFTCVEDDFLPPGEYPVATLIYRDRDGATVEVFSELTERC